MALEPRRFANLDEIKASFNWVPRIEIDSSEVEKFIGDYSFRQAEPCALADCQTRHKNGFVALSRSGLAFLVGHICGKRRWELVYGEHAKRYYARQRFIATSGQIANALAQEYAVKLHLRELYDRNPHGLKWVARARLGLARSLPRTIYERLMKMARRGETQITRQRLASADERELRRMTGSRVPENESLYIDENIGALDGLIAIREDIDAPRVNILSGFERYRATDPAALTARERVDAKKWVQALSSNISVLDQVVMAAPRFFCAANFQLFVELTANFRERSFLTNCAYWDFARGHAIKQFDDWRNVA
jgi:hypothetical protein